jgi:uncharacterized protein YegL
VRVSDRGVRGGTEVALNEEPDLVIDAEFALVEFADNPEPRCAVVLLLDTSGSMEGQRIAELNSGLRALDQALKGDALASLRVELAVVTFGGKVRALDVRQGGQAEVPFDADRAFVTVDGFQPPELLAHGSTPMGEAVRQGLQLIRDRKAIYKQHGIDYFRPWVFLITDGKPTDRQWQGAASDVRDEEQQRGVSFYAVGVAGADMDKLSRFSSERQPLKLKGLAFEELFEWLSKSLSAVSQSRPGDQTPLPPVGWADIES